MLPPMRPKPTIPTCMKFLSSGEGLHDGLLQPRQSRSDVGPKMHPDGAPPAFVQHLEIASRRRIDHCAETVFASGYRDVDTMVAGDLKEDAGVRTALIGLAGRMQKAWSEADAGRDPFAVADHR